MHSLLFVEAIVGALMVLFVSHEFKRYRSRIRQFPGPVGLPLIGNLWQLHRQNAPEVYRSWSTRYGDVFQIQLGDVPVLVVNSAKAAKAIFSQESQASASRPTFYTFHQVSMGLPNCCSPCRFISTNHSPHRSDHIPDIRNDFGY